MENFIDTSFDKDFEQNDNYTWLPWVGKRFTESKTRTLILGESTYNWGVKEQTIENVQERLSKKNHLRIVHKNNAIDFNGKSPYARNIERALLLKKRTSKTEAQLLWVNTAYHNLVLRAMPTKKHRPKYNDYLKGWNTFIHLVQVLEVENCIVYGLEKNKLESFKEALTSNGIEFNLNKSKENIGRSYPRTAIIKVANKEIKLLFIRHPSSFFSWKKWGNLLNKELDITELISE
ncbi:MAG: hypothetical protein QNK36_20305 [Colwellia sp.]|nr:hypothetical protein [Colwellia sp.]